MKTVFFNQKAVCCDFFKKIKKSLKNPLTNEDNWCIIVKHNCEGHLRGCKTCSLKIEQHEISSTEKCEISLKNTLKKETQKVKKSRKEFF